jgi:hypothetical protein
MAHDPITAPTITLAARREPAFHHAGDVGLAQRRLADYSARHGRQPNLSSC